MSSPFGDIIEQFSDLYQTFTVENLSSTDIDDEGYVTEDYGTSVTVKGVLIPRSRADFLGHGYELKGEVFLYISIVQEDWPGINVGDALTDSDGIIWKVVSERDYSDTGNTKILGLERDVK